MLHIAPRRAGLVLASLRPYALVASVCRVGRWHGLAVSDPYLSCATPLAAVPVSGGVLALQSALRRLPIGALLLGLPLRQRGRANGAPRSLGIRLSQGACVIGRLPRLHGAPPSLAEARAKQRDDPLWGEVGLPLDGARISPAVHAAACLQTVLDEEMGGWPNTFG